MLPCGLVVECYQWLRPWVSRPAPAYRTAMSLLWNCIELFIQEHLTDPVWGHNFTSWLARNLQVYVIASVCIVRKEQAGLMFSSSLTPSKFFRTNSPMHLIPTPWTSGMKGQWVAFDFAKSSDAFINISHHSWGHQLATDSIYLTVPIRAPS